MLHIGAHLSAAKGFLHMGKEALSIQADTFQFFTRNPRGGAAKDLNPQDILAFQELAETHGFQPILAHAPYTLNPAAANPETRAFALQVMADDMKRMEALPHNLYNFHPGSHVGQGTSVGITLICDILNTILTPEQNTTVLLETMSGKGSEIGSTFEELSEIIQRTVCQDKIGVCLDTCHVYSAGYDIRQDLDGVLEHFDRVIGLNRLKAIHLNDSLTPFNSHKDRHEKLGKGSLGLEAIIRFVTHPALKEKPFFLETPQDDITGYKNEIALLRATVD